MVCEWGNMPYLQPLEVLEKFSEYLNSEVSDVIPETDTATRSQVGSMSSTMQYLTNEFGGMRVSYRRQVDAFTNAIESVEEEVDRGDGAEQIMEALEDARRAITEQEDPTTPASIRDAEADMLQAVDNLLVEINELPRSRAEKLRPPLYNFMDERISAQMALLRGNLNTG